jgi:heme/copper-type cytochrome/quinol oxidase subunit 2
MDRLQRGTLMAFAGVVVAAAVYARGVTGDQSQVREITVDANQFAFSPARIEVQRDDLVKITFSAKDIAHTFTLDAYRIDRRAGAGQSVTVEFRADQAGRFPFYRNLKQDERCRQMKGELVVR